MKRITPKRVMLFVAVMTAVAFVIYLPRYEWDQQQVQVALQQQRVAENEAATRKTAKDAAAEHAQFLARYVDAAFVKRPGVQTVALAVASTDAKMDRATANAFIQRFQSEAVQILPSFFKPSFVSDGLFDSAFNGVDDISQKLELSKSLDELLLAKESVEYSTNGADLGNVITATMRLDVTVLPVTGNSTGQTWSFTAAGSGFSRTAAQAMAEERIIKQITNDKKISL